MSITFLSHTAMGGDFVVGSHHLAAALAARGLEVRHVSAAVTPAHLLSLREGFVRARVARWWRGGSRIAGVHDIVPFSPLPWPVARTRASLMRAHSRWMLAWPGRSLAALERDGGRHTIVDEPRFLGLALSGRARTAQGTLSYRATDLYAAMRGDPRIADAERELCHHADAIIATSETIAAHLRALCGRHVHVITNGVEFEHFATLRLVDRFPLPTASARMLRAVYVGAFDARFCSASLHAAARAHPARTFVLAGPGSERVARQMSLSNIEAMGSVAYHDLPALLQGCAVGLLPFSMNSANTGRSPMKLFEYAAAGLAVAATQAFQPGRVSLPTLARANATGDFVGAVGAAFEYAADATRIAQAREIARAQDWNAKAGELLRIVAPARVEMPSLDPGTLEVPLLPARSSWN